MTPAPNESAVWFPRPMRHRMGRGLGRGEILWAFRLFQSAPLPVLRCGVREKISIRCVCQVTPRPEECCAWGGALLCFNHENASINFPVDRFVFDWLRQQKFHHADRRHERHERESTHRARGLSRRAGQRTSPGHLDGGHRADHASHPGLQRGPRPFSEATWMSWCRKNYWRKSPPRPTA